MDEDVRKALLWLAEQAMPRSEHDVMEAVCGGCGHAIRFHLADRTYEACMFPKADIRLCRCNHFMVSSTP